LVPGTRNCIHKRQTSWGGTPQGTFSRHSCTRFMFIWWCTSPKKSKSHNFKSSFSPYRVNDVVGYLREEGKTIIWSSNNVRQVLASSIHRWVWLQVFFLLPHKGCMNNGCLPL
jgi:hypothetical protein